MLYLLFGVIWILLTDTVVTNVAETSAQVTRLQTLKGWVFVGLSTALILGLTSVRDKQITAARSFTDLALDSLHDILVSLDSNGGIQRVNERAVTVTGYRESELLDADPVRLFAPEDRKAIADAYETGAARYGRPW